MVIDIHTHCFPDSLSQRAISVLAEKSGIPHHTDGTVGDLKRSMKEAGIHISVLLPIATKPEQTAGINRWATEVQDERIKSFGTIHPDCSDWKEQIEFLVSHGIRGVKFHPEYQDFYVDDERLFPIYDALFSKGLAVLFHAGADLGYPPPCHCPPQRLRKVFDLFPTAKIIAAHMGGYRHWDEVEEYLVGTNVFLDTSFAYEGLGKSRMERIIRSHGADKILFGSDSPWVNQQRTLDDIRTLRLSGQERKRILGLNAQHILNISCD